MRIFLAGASGVLGLRLVPLLVTAGHQVVGMTRTPGKVDRLGALGAEPVVCDVFDAGALREAVVAARPDAVMHQLSDLPDDPSLMRAFTAANSRIRREGTRNLLAAAGAAGATRLLAQSVAWEPAGEWGAAIRELEEATLAAGGVVLRYGHLHGPGTYYEQAPPPPPPVHVDHAARRTVAALTAPSGVLTIVDDAAPPAR
jgi:nucleoside-diphosphate-sugar epimerase